VNAQARVASRACSPFSDWSGATALDPDAEQSGRFRRSSVIAVNTQAAAHHDVGLRWNDEIGV
jgi:hypothetical protein